MSYKEADAKPTRDLINYNTVFGPDLREVEAQIGGNTTPETLLSKFEPEAETFSDSHVSDVVDFLHALDFIERPEDRVIEQMNRNAITNDGSVNTSFEIRLLYHLRQQTHPQDHLTRVHDVAIDNEERTVSREQLETDLNRELDSYGFDWNEQKVRMWERLFSNLGVISRTSEEGTILSPSRGLLYELLSLHSETEGSTDLNDALEWIDDNFMKVYRSRAGTPTVHIAVAQVLENMEEDGTVEFRGMADASNEVELPAGQSSGVQSRVLKSYSIGSKPSGRAAYALPMDQTDSKRMMGDAA
jgi:hypothetical protein